MLRLARENSSWGYRRIHGDLAALGIKVAASTVWEVLRGHGIDPAPRRDRTTWEAFLRSQADALPACDFLETRTLTGARLYVFAVIGHANRRIRILGAATAPTADWTTRLARNLGMDLQDAGSRAAFMIRDRDSKFAAAFDAVNHPAPEDPALRPGIWLRKQNKQLDRLNSQQRAPLDDLGTWRTA